jgi:ABC-type transporter Mla subunit MlaD
MPREPGALTRLARLRADLTPDREALEARAAEVRSLAEQAAGGAGLPRPELVLLAANLHGYYTALETALERIARLFDEDVPSGPSWHQEILEQMRIEVPGLRAPVLAPELIPDLQELRRFRHFFRNAYVLDLDPHKVNEHAQRLVRVHRRLTDNIGAFVEHLEAVLSELAQDDDAD